MKCPNCRNQYNYKKDKRPNGNTTCLICETTAPTSEWRKRPKTRCERELETELAAAKGLNAELLEILGRINETGVISLADQLEIKSRLEVLK